MASSEVKPTVLRVKRRLNEISSDEIIISSKAAVACSKAEEAQKRPRMAMDQMLLQMTGMGLAQPAGGPHDQHVHHYSNSTPSLAPKRQRFKKISTVSISVFDGKSIEEVHLLLASWSAVVASEIKPTERGSSHAHAHAQGRRVYKHVKSTRQQNPTGGQPGSSDKGPFLVLDVICMDSETSYSDAGVNEKKLLEEARKVKEERERQLMTSFLPMVGEFLEGQKAQGESKRSQRKVPSSSRGAGGSSREGQHKDHPEGSVPTPTSTSTSTPTPTPTPMDFVYDVYLPAPTPMDEEGGPGDEHTPVIEVDDDEMWYEDPVDDESEAGKSEDSNAESYYANSYPDEEAEEDPDQEWEDEMDDMVGEEEAVHYRQGSMRRVEGRFGREEYDLTETDEEEEEEKEKATWRSKLMK